MPIRNQLYRTARKLLVAEVAAARGSNSTQRPPGASNKPTASSLQRAA